MRLIRGLHNLPTLGNAGCAVTIGNYDGVHRGHQQILLQLKAQAQALNIPAAALIFEPQPEEFFTNDRSLRLSSLREKLQMFHRYGIDIVVVINFTAQFATMSAAKFVEEILVARLRARYIVVGDDFAFGHNRSGNFALLQRYGALLGIGVEQVAAFKIGGTRVSSSLIRAALLHGNMATATQFLGRPYRAGGRVIQGDHMGRELGFPTVNIHMVRRELVLSGIYAVRVYGAAAQPMEGVANIGLCPTLTPRLKKTFEVYIFAFNGDLYGKRLEVEFIQKIREEKKFTRVADLICQIENDVVVAQEILTKK